MSQPMDGTALIFPATIDRSVAFDVLAVVVQLGPVASASWAEIASSGVTLLVYHSSIEICTNVNFLRKWSIGFISPTQPITNCDPMMVCGTDRRL
jgi:hypothetical protein